MPKHTRLNHIVQGTHEDTLVLLHGFMGRAASFRHLLNRLSDRFRVMAIDLPGHGDSRFETSSDLRKLTSFSAVAQAVLNTVLSLQDVNEFHLYGYSMGGRVAQNVCLLAPEKIKRLMLESAAFGIEDDMERKQRYEKDRHLLSSITSTDNFRHFLDQWHALPLFSTLADTPILENLTQQKLENAIPELRKALDLMSTGNHPFFAPALSRLTIPIFYLYGEHDEKYKTIAQNTVKIIPHMHVRCIKNASHNIHVQFPDRIVSHLIPELCTR